MEANPQPEEAKEASYTFTNDQQKVLGPTERPSLIKAFKAYDLNKNHEIDQDEFKNVLIDVGYRKITDDKVKEMLAAQDQNNDGVIDWNEFCNMMCDLKKVDDTKFGTIVELKGERINQLTNIHGGQHFYALEEVATFAKIFNHVLKDDEDCADKVPIDCEDTSLFYAVDNGVILCKILRSIDPDCIMDSAINKGHEMNVYLVQENLKMVIAAAKGMGIKMIGIDANNFINHTEHLILGCIWQVVRKWVSMSINLKDTPEILKLAINDETMQDLLKLQPEVILIRWVNYHLEKAGQEKRIKNLGKDLADSEALIYVLNQLGGDDCPLDALGESEVEVRAENMISSAIKLGVPDVVRPRDITSGNVKVNTLFVSYIFNTKHGLEELTAEEYEAAGMIDDDVEGTVEERTFRLWINSLDIEGCYCDNLYDDCRDGVLLCKVIHKINDSIVDWKKVREEVKNDFDKNGNNNEAIAACKKMGLKMIGLGGTDLTKGIKKNVLAIVWQIVRVHYLHIIGDKTEKDLVAWANGLVGDKCPPIKDLKDKSMGDGKFLLTLCAGMEPRAVNWDIAQEPAEDDEGAAVKNNAKYVISVARKLGAVIFCIWENIVNVDAKQTFILVCTLNQIHEAMKAE